MRKVWHSAAAAWWLSLPMALAAAALAAFPATPQEHHVVVISIDGMGASWYMAPPEGLKTPNLDRLKAAGSYAEGVEGVYPSVTYPSHTTIVTGRMPAEHGVYSNLSSRVAGKNPKDWFWDSKVIKVPTLWDEARRARLTTAAVFWPVTVNAAVDWNVPEVWDPVKGPVGDPAYVAKFATPGLLFEAMMALGAPPANADDDVTRTRVAAFILTKHTPNLELIHLAMLDHDEHDFGPRSPEAKAQLERIDARVGEILDAARAGGIEPATDIFIVSDHGFLPIEREIRPNVLLAKAGLLTVDANGQVTGGRIATVANGGSFFIYWPEGEDYRARIDAALKPLRDQGLLWGVLGRAALHDLGAEPAVQLALEAPEGSSFNGGASGEVVFKLPHPAGTHGFLPTRRWLESAFIAAGPSIRQGVNLHRIRMTSIGPTILKVMGVADPSFSPEPPLEDILK